MGWSTAIGIAALAIAVVLLATSAVGSCPLYALLRIRTNAKTAA